MRSASSTVRSCSTAAEPTVLFVAIQARVTRPASTLCPCSSSSPSRSSQVSSPRSRRAYCPCSLPPRRERTSDESVAAVRGDGRTVLSFTAFTLAGAALLNALGLPQDLLRTIAIAALFVLAASLLSQRFARIVERPFLFLTRRPIARESNGFVVGVSAGLVMVPCAGPVLAAVAALAATGEVTWRVVLVTAAYASATPSRSSRSRSEGRGSRPACASSDPRPRAETGSGCRHRLTALAIVFHAPERLATAVPGYTQAFQERIERSSSAQRELAKLSGVPSASEAFGPRAPESRASRAGSTRRQPSRSLWPASADGSCWSTSGRTRASTACARSPTSNPGTRLIATPDSRSSECTARSSPSSVCPTTSARQFAGSAWRIRSRSTTISRPGVRTRTSTGRRST